MPVGPGLDREDGGEETETGLGEPVLVPVGVPAVADTFEQTVFDQRGETGGEDVAADAEVALEVAVATHAEERLPENEEGPAVSEHVERALDGIRLGASGRVVHPGKLVHERRVDCLVN